MMMEKESNTMMRKDERRLYNHDDNDNDKMKSVVRFHPELVSSGDNNNNDGDGIAATAIMREFDGDILELGVEELSESNTATPVTEPHVHSSNPPTLDLTCSSNMEDDTSPSSSESGTRAVASSSSSSTGCQEEEGGVVFFNKSNCPKMASSEISLSSSRKNKTKHTESKLFFPVNTHNNNNNNNNNKSNNNNNNKNVIIHPDNNNPIHSELSPNMMEETNNKSQQLSQLMHRSKSYDRRLSEATQYYESVGEIPPTYEDDIIRGVIIEEDTSSDDDDDDDEDDDDDDDEMDAGSVVLASTRNPDASDYTTRRHSFLSSTCQETTEEQPQPHSTSPCKTPISDDSTTPSSSNHNSSIQQSIPTGEPSHSTNRSVQTVGEEPASAVVVVGPSSTTNTNNNNSTSSSDTIMKKYGPFNQLSSIGQNLLAIRTGSNTNGNQTNYVYKGIRHNPPEITKRGISRGNFAQLHRKAWLEVSDKYHRYGKNLRLYYKHWEKLGHPTNMFFDWLDSKGEAAGQPLPNLPECPRAVLDADTVMYITNPDKQERYKFQLVASDTEKGTCLIIDDNGDPLYTGSQGWIFVLRDQELYAAPKVTSVSGKAKQRFHHSSFFGGKAVVFAGILITDKSGRLKSLYPHSGHYRPGEAHMQRMVFYLHHTGVDLSSILIDMQQIMHVSREKSDLSTPKGGKVTSSKENNNEDTTTTTTTHQVKTKKAKKSDSLYMKSGTYVALFLGHKASMIEHGVFHHLHKIKRVGGMSVTRILHQIDNGGIWNRKNHY